MNPWFSSFWRSCLSTLGGGETKREDREGDLEGWNAVYLFETATGRVIYSYSNPRAFVLIVRTVIRPTPGALRGNSRYSQKRIRPDENRYGVLVFAVRCFAPPRDLGALGIYAMPTAALEQRKEFLIET